MLPQRQEDLVKEWIFKLTPIHASLIAEFNKTSGWGTFIEWKCGITDLSVSSLFMNRGDSRNCLLSVDSSYAAQFALRFLPKCANHICSYWFHTGFMKRFWCWLLTDWLKRNDVDDLFRDKGLVTFSETYFQDVVRDMKEKFSILFFITDKWHTRTFCISVHPSLV